MARPLKFTADQVVAALRETRGTIYLAAERLGCDHDTINNYAKRYKAVRAEIHHQSERMVDVAELKLYQAVMDGDQGMIKYLLSTRGKKRGYTTGHELSGPDGKPLEVIVKGYKTVSPDGWDAD